MRISRGDKNETPQNKATPAMINGGVTDYTLFYATTSKAIQILQLFFLDQKKPKQISDILNISFQYVYKIINQHKLILAESIRNLVE